MNLASDPIKTVIKTSEKPPLNQQPKQERQLQKQRLQKPLVQLHLNNIVKLSNKLSTPGTVVTPNEYSFDAFQKKFTVFIQTSIFGQLVG